MSDFINVPAFSDIGALAHGFGTAAFDLDVGAEHTETINRRVRATSFATAIKRACSEAGPVFKDVLTVKQIHSANTLVVRRNDRFIPPANTIRCDAIVTDCVGLMIGIRTADCLPIFIFDPRRPAVAAIHAGWRGTHQRIIRHVIDRMMKEFGSQPEELLVALGPSAGPCCYEVSAELADEFSVLFGDKAVWREAGKASLDLPTINRIQAEEYGVLPHHIHHAAHCTICSVDPTFYSWRRERERAGRQYNYIGLC